MLAVSQAPACQPVLVAHSNAGPWRVVKPSAWCRICSTACSTVKAQGPLQGVPIAGCLGDQQAAMMGQRCAVSEAKNTYGTGALRWQRVPLAPCTPACSACGPGSSFRDAPPLPPLFLSSRPLWPLPPSSLASLLPCAPPNTPAGCFMLLNTGPELVQSSHGLLSTLAFQLGADAAPNYALEGSIAIAGQGISWLRDRMGFIDSAGGVGWGGRAGRLGGGVGGGMLASRQAQCPAPVLPRQLLDAIENAVLRRGVAENLGPVLPSCSPSPACPCAWPWALQRRARRWRGLCPTAAACTLCPPLGACWRPGGGTTRGAQLWASRNTAPRCGGGGLAVLRGCVWLARARLVAALHPRRPTQLRGGAGVTCSLCRRWRPEPPSDRALPGCPRACLCRRGPSGRPSARPLLACTPPGGASRAHRSRPHTRRTQGPGTPCPSPLLTCLPPVPPGHPCRRT